MKKRKDDSPPKPRGPEAAGSSKAGCPPKPRTGADGKPIYNQEFFLALARCGKAVWNAWRAENPGIRVSFARVDFREPENSMIDFSDFVFGDRTDFSNCRFGDGPRPLSCQIDMANERFVPSMANFMSATFGYRANLSGATFGDWAIFVDATFGDEANLSGATFGDWAIFFDATVGNEANFSGATFGDEANFSNATLGNQPNLTCATFGEYVNFDDATFGHEANFSGAVFGGGANLCRVVFWHSAKLCGVVFGDGSNLSGASFGYRTNLSGAVFVGEVDFRGESQEKWVKFRSSHNVRHWPEERKKQFLQWPEHASSPPDGLGSISFSGAKFHGEADFSGREIRDGVDFTSARFDQPPVFDSLAKGDFYGARIGFTSRKFPWLQGWTTDTNVANRLRHLRKQAEESKNHDLERDIFVEERKAERGIYFKRYWNEARENVRRRWLKVERSGSQAITSRFIGTPTPSDNVWREWLTSGSLQDRAAQALFTCRQIPLTALRLLIHAGWIVVMSLYWLIANYGRSFLRPAIALFLSLFVFHAAYSLVLTPPPSADELLFKQAVRTVTLANAVPFVGALARDKAVKEQLFCGGPSLDPAEAAKQDAKPCVPIPPLRFQVLAIAQGIFSVLCLFFIGLALRNHFRVR